MTQAILVSGNQQGLFQYAITTPALSAGDIVVLGGRPFVAVHDIPANTTGTLSGWGGIYKLPKDDTSGPAITIGEEVAWIDGSDLATDVITGNTHFGYAVGAAGASTTPVLVQHMPKGLATNPTS